MLRNRAESILITWWRLKLAPSGQKHPTTTSSNLIKPASKPLRCMITGITRHQRTPQSISLIQALSRHRLKESRGSEATRTVRLLQPIFIRAALKSFTHQTVQATTIFRATTRSRTTATLIISMTASLTNTWCRLSLKIWFATRSEASRRR